jgi:hypothetical protein
MLRPHGLAEQVPEKAAKDRGGYVGADISLSAAQPAIKDDCDARFLAVFMVPSGLKTYRITIDYQVTLVSDQGNCLRPGFKRTHLIVTASLVTHHFISSISR